LLENKAVSTLRCDGVEICELLLRRRALRRPLFIPNPFSAVAYLEMAYLNEAYLEGANISKAHLEQANLSIAHLTGANLNKTHLEQAMLYGAHLVLVSAAK
jgi:uncharacterized protein YjbI with pentapeptide repeats